MLGKRCDRDGRKAAPMRLAGRMRADSTRPLAPTPEVLRESHRARPTPVRHYRKRQALTVPRLKALLYPRQDVSDLRENVR